MISTLGKQGDQGVRPGSKTPKLTPSDHFLQQGPTSQKFHKLPRQQMPSAGDQVFKYMSLWGWEEHFTFKAQHCVFHTFSVTVSEALASIMYKKRNVSSRPFSTCSRKVGTPSREVLGRGLPAKWKCDVQSRQAIWCVCSPLTRPLIPSRGHLRAPPHLDHPSQRPHTQHHASEPGC